MARFFVGQRVRIKWSYYYPELNGQSGTIVGEMDDSYFDGDDEGCEWYVAPDCWGSHECPYDGNDFAPSSSQLDPITDRQETVTWEECAWSPHRVDA